MTDDEKKVSQEFHKLFYGKYPFECCRWFGVPICKNPMDLWIYQELLFRIRPQLVIELGTFKGGATVYIASILDLLGRGLVLSIDKEQRERPHHPRINYGLGDTLNDETVQFTFKMAAEVGSPIMVIADSAHEEDHVLSELRKYSPLVSLGSYYIVEDTNIAGNPVRPDMKSGPKEAVATFLEENATFKPDTECERFFLTFNPGGFLKKVSVV